MGTGERRLKRLVVTGDDFGLSRPVNEAIEAAHRDGILTATCLMVAAPEAADAVARAKALPGLGVGLHVVVARGRAILPPAQIPDLVDADGNFDDNLVRAGFRYFFLPHVRTQLAAEIRAQFDAFARTGLALDHVNAHNHMHVHPTVFGLILRIGRDYGMRAIRIPYEPAPGLANAIFQRWADWAKRRARRTGVRCNDAFYGLNDTGRLDRTRMLGLLARLSDGVSEIMCHPATEAWGEVDPKAVHYGFADELAALLDPEVRSAIATGGIQLSNYRSVAW